MLVTLLHYHCIATIVLHNLLHYIDHKSITLPLHYHYITITLTLHYHCINITLPLHYHYTTTTLPLH